MPLLDLADIRLWNMPPTAGLDAINGADFLIILSDDFVTIATEQTITAKKTFDEGLEIANAKTLDFGDGVGGSISALTMTSIIELGSNARALSLRGNGDTNLVSVAGLDNNVEIQGNTGQSALLRMQGVDIVQPITDLQPADVWLQTEPISQSAGGAMFTGISDADAPPLIIRSYFGVVNPTSSTPAIQFRTGKTDGGTGIVTLSDSERAFQISDFDGAADFFTIGGSGNIALGGLTPDVTKTVTVQGFGSDNVFAVKNVAEAIMFESDTADLTVATGANAADTMLIVNDDSTSGRSINASGTINASGADYAEYETKKNVNDNIEKGDVVGFDEDGLLTTKFSEAVSFGIKSTKPAYVGGDDWGSEKVIGDKPEKPVLIKPEYIGSEKPTDKPTEPEAVTPLKKLEKLNPVKLAKYAIKLSQYKADVAQYELDLAIFNPLMEQYQIDMQFHNDAIEVLKTDLEENQIPAYEAERKTWKDKLESERVKVDRIAYAGKVPVNDLIGNAGDFVIPKLGLDDTIAVKSVSVANMTFDDYKIKIGQIHHVEQTQTIVTVSMG